ncbi:MAG TPA: low temperature requirement protein A, partial [Aquihabitans sp.]|nr:low temperature requirement protein A [Aquihabitans sp.]
RVVGMALQVRIDLERDVDDGLSMPWVYVSTLGLVFVLAGALADESLRPWLWLVALALDLAASAAASGNATWDISPGHFSERHGLFVIIALGESLIVAASAVAEEERTADLVLAAGASLAVACLLWWTYFGWLKEAMEERFASGRAGAFGTVARDAYSLTHFPLVCGIVGFAVAVEEIVLHPERPAEGPVIASLVVGIALFVGATTLAYWRTTRHLLVSRLVIVAVTLVVVVLLRDADPVWPLAAVALGLLAVIVVEELRDRRRAAEHDAALAAVPAGT